MDERLKQLLLNFNKKLIEAQHAREKVMEYLEIEYDIDTNAECTTLEDENDWCYGIDLSGLTNLLTK